MDNRAVNYTYSAADDLVSVSLADGKTINYAYSSDGNRYITKVTKSDGRVLENIYNSTGRVVSQKATVDPSSPDVLVQNAIFDYTTLGQTKVTNAYGQDTIYVHSNGLITAVHEPEGRSTLKEWYATTNSATGAYQRSLKKLTDPRGLITEYKYDAQGNVTETKITGDLDGDPATPATETHIVTALYNALNLPVWSADSATGLTTDYFYEDTDYPRLPTRVATKHTSTGTPLRTDKFEYTERDATAPPPGTAPIFAKGLLEKLTLALGTPLISYFNAGTKDLLNCENSVVVSPDSDDDLVHAMISLQKAPGLCAKLAVNGIEVAKTNTLDATHRRRMELARQVVERRRPVPAR